MLVSLATFGPSALPGTSLTGILLTLQARMRARMCPSWALISLHCCPRDVFFFAARACVGGCTHT